MTPLEPEPATVRNHPTHEWKNQPQKNSLTVWATGENPIYYQWYRGSSGDTSRPIPYGRSPTLFPYSEPGENRFWVRVTNAQRPGGMDSQTAEIKTVPQTKTNVSSRWSKQPLANILNWPGSGRYGGRSWPPSSANYQFSADGRCAIHNNHSISKLQTSTDYGKTWLTRSGTPDSTWEYVAISPDGSVMAAIVLERLLQDRWLRHISISKDGGETWTRILSKTATLRKLTLSNQGSVIAVLMQKLYGAKTTVCVSSDGGLNWSEHIPHEQIINWTDLTVSADGTRMAISHSGYDDVDVREDTRTWGRSDVFETRESTTKNGALYISEDAGLSWRLSTQAVSWPLNLTGGYAKNVSVALSADGQTLLANFGGLLITSKDGGYQWESHAIKNVYDWEDLNVTPDGTQLTGLSTDNIVYALAPTPVVSGWTFQDERARLGAYVGNAIDLRIDASNAPTGYRVKGLPRGLVLNAATGRITGIPEVAGTFDVTVTAFSAQGSSQPVKIRLVIKELHPTWSGNFYGIASRAVENGQLGGQWNLSVTRTGLCTFKYSSSPSRIDVSISVKGRLVAAPDAESASLTVTHFGKQQGLTLELKVDQDGVVTGILGQTKLNGWHCPYHKIKKPATAREGRYSMSITRRPNGSPLHSQPDGVGFCVFEISSIGTVKYAGSVADGGKFTCSSLLSISAHTGLHAQLDSRMSSLSGEFTVDDERWVVTSLSWLKSPKNNSLLYPYGFGSNFGISMDCAGGFLSPLNGFSRIFGLPTAGAATLEFSGADISKYTPAPDVSVVISTDNQFILKTKDGGNTAGVTLKINEKTGAVTGSFNVFTQSSKIGKKTAFFAQVIPQKQNTTTIRAAGFFLLPALYDAGQQTYYTPIHSGVVKLSQDTSD